MQQRAPRERRTHDEDTSGNKKQKLHYEDVDQEPSRTCQDYAADPQGRKGSRRDKTDRSLADEDRSGKPSSSSSQKPRPKLTSPSASEPAPAEAGEGRRAPGTDGSRRLRRSARVAARWASSGASCGLAVVETVFGAVLLGRIFGYLVRSSVYSLRCSIDYFNHQDSPYCRNTVSGAAPHTLDPALRKRQKLPTPKPRMHMKYTPLVTLQPLLSQRTLAGSKGREKSEA